MAGFYERWMDPNVKQTLIQGYGMYGPPLYRYAMYLRNMFTYGLVPPYFGWSSYDWDFIGNGLARRLPITLFLMGTSLIIIVTLGILIGVFAASMQGTKKDVTITASALLTWGLPIFFTEYLAQFLFLFLYNNYGIKVFPIVGMTSVPAPSGLALYADMAWHFTLPIICLVLAGLGSWILYTRNMIVDILTQDYIVTARAKGLSERTIIFKHAFKSILPQISTMISTSTAALLTGCMITETIFGIEGIGLWYLKVVYPTTPGALPVRFVDPAVTAAVFFIYTTVVVALNLIADLMYGVFDPRIRVGNRR